MPVTKLQLAETPFGGDKDRRIHRYILEANSMTEEEVYDFLTTEDAGTFPGGLEVERPDGSTVTTGFPILFEYDGRVIDNIEYEHERDCDPEIYRLTVTYQNPSSSGGGGGGIQQVGTAGIRYSFEIGSENETIKQSLLTVSDYASDVSTRPNVHRAINVQPDGTVEGVQIPSSASQFSIEYTDVFGWFTPTRRMNIGRLAGKVNDTTLNFGGVTYSPGEVRFLGAAGEITSAGNSTIELRFGVRENQSGITIPGIDESSGLTEGGSPVAGGIVLDGWDYLWVKYGKGVESGQLSAQPEAAYVDRILRRANLNGIFS